jgi:hypothetical protein
VFFQLWGVPFVLVGLYLIVGRFFADAKLRSKTHYGLTNQRIIIVSGLFSRTTKSLQLRTLSDVSLDESNGSFGTITFGPAAPWWVGAAGWPSSRRQLSPSFDSISRLRSSNCPTVRPYGVTGGGHPSEIWSHRPTRACDDGCYGSCLSRNKVGSWPHHILFPHQTRSLILNQTIATDQKMISICEWGSSVPGQQLTFVMGLEHSA